MCIVNIYSESYQTYKKRSVIILKSIILVQLCVISASILFRSASVPESVSKYWIKDK